MSPYVEAWRRRASNQRRADGLVPALQALGGPIVATALLVPLVQPVFLSFLDAPREHWDAGVVQVTLRAGILLVGLLAVDVFTAVVRAPDRDILALLPVDAAAVVRYAVLRVAVVRWWLLPALAAVIAPVAARGAPGLWALALLVLLGAWVMGLAVSAMVHLLAVEIAEDPRWAAILDAVRGHNPRAQAAFLYAPGAVLLLCGLLVAQGASAVARVAAGEAAGWPWLAAPFPVAALAWSRVARLARSRWFQASGVLAEIDARYAMLADREEGLRVYLDWAVRFLSPSVRRYALHDLRHGWRARRSLVTLAGVLGVVGFVAGWTSSAEGPTRAALVAIGGAWACAAQGVLLSQDEPAFLRAWLPPRGLEAASARVLVLAAWIAPCVVLPALSTGLRHGGGGAGVVLGAGAGSAVVAIAGAMACGRVERGLAIYAPTATVAAAVASALVVVGP